jgi:hypothetical protein
MHRGACTRQLFNNSNVTFMYGKSSGAWFDLQKRQKERERDSKGKCPLDGEAKESERISTRINVK